MSSISKLNADFYSELFVNRRGFVKGICLVVGLWNIFHDLVSIDLSLQFSSLSSSRVHHKINLELGNNQDQNKVGKKTGR